MSEPKSTTSHAWLLVAGVALTVLGGLGLLLLDIRWHILKPVGGLVLNGATLLADALRMLFTVDYRFSASLLVLLLGLSGLFASLYLRYFRLLGAREPAPVLGEVRAPSRLVGLVRHGWPVAALLIAFLVALARGATDEFLKETAERGLTVLGSFLIAVPIVLLLILGMLAWDSRKK